MHTLARSTWRLFRLFAAFCLAMSAAPGALWAGMSGGAAPAVALGALDLVAVAAGSTHTCALTAGGAVICWGNNESGQLGDGTTTGSLKPVAVNGLASGVAAVAAGGDHTCALTTAGGVKCWGQNGSGRLGDGTTRGRPAPVDVIGLSSGVVAVTAGGSHTCALTAGGGVKCWGANGSGQLGDGTNQSRNTPVDVSGLSSGVATVAAGDSHTSAVTTAGAVKCWGANYAGQLGDGTTTNRNAPAAVSGPLGASGAAAVSAGSPHTSALTTEGGVKCWGAGGLTGDGTTAQRLAPVAVSGPLGAGGAAAVAAGGSQTSARTTAGGVKCWGSNSYGELGDGTTAQRLAPVDVSGPPGVSGVTAVAAGGSHTSALTAAGRLQCWGKNSRGQLGDRTIATGYAPMDVSGPLGASGVAAVTAGGSHTCVLTVAGGIQCWGGGGRLGDGTSAWRHTPAAVSGPLGAGGVTAVAAGGSHTCARTTAGGVKCWGSNGWGQLGDGTTSQRLEPVAVSGPLGAGGVAAAAGALAAGGYHTSAVTMAGGVTCWGSNDRGQLGDSTQTQRLEPVAVSGPLGAGGVTGVAAGAYHTCALTAAGGVKCWGSNDWGQLGDGTTDQHLAPVDVSGLASGVAAITAGDSHTCALTVAGGVKCWGMNIAGQLGDGSGSYRQLTPVDVSGPLGASGVAAVSAGDYFTCALTTAAGLKCWGSNHYGQLGDGTIVDHDTPVSVSGPPGTSGAAAVSAGGYHACAVTPAGGVKCWGLNDNGQVGVPPYRATPADVLYEPYGARLPLIMQGGSHANRNRLDRSARA